MHRTLFFLILFFCECFARERIWYPYTGGSVRRPHLTYGQRNFCTHFFDVATKPLLSEITYDILTRAGPKRLSKNRFFFGTGSRRGVTPGRLGARNRWFLKGFGAEGSLQDAWPGPTFLFIIAASGRLRACVPMCACVLGDRR